MAGQDSTGSTYGAFESLQSYSSSSIRRARPPDIMTFLDENRVPLRADGQTESISKRESRVGLRSIFGRSKTGKESKDSKESENPSSPREWPTSIRASLAEISNWPYGLHSPRSEAAMSSPLPPPPPSWSMSSQPISSRGRASPALPAPIRKASTTTWNPPPLFQVYPQAIKYVTLPACTLSVDALLRLNGKRSSLLGREDPTNSNHDQEDDVERKTENGRRRHQHSGSRSSTLDWTKKVYALVTSGYLLQYSAEGSFDRLPEKILQLSKDSAVFASDLIPGKHWVLQISSSMDADGTPSADSRSLLSKLSLRPSEKKHISNVLMVFESAEEMEGWLATLRRMIEALGGKKKLTETGKPKTEDKVVPLKAQLSQRTLVVRDPERFSNVVPQDFSWTPGKNAARPSPESLSGLLSTEAAPELPLDDVSTTESHYSSDGQHLDSLRDSGNRLSFISSGARTIMTSAGSSPACSPIRPSFISHADDAQRHDGHQDSRLRPNAQAIAERRRSMQTILPPFDFPIDPETRPHSTVSNASNPNDGHHYVSNRQSIPNFSVPHAVNRRLSGLRTTPLEEPSVAEQEIATKSVRKPPPTSLGLSRPLSIVVDQPSPLCSPKEVTTVAITSQVQSPAQEVPDSPSMFSSWVRTVAKSPKKGELPCRGSSLAPERQPSPAIHVRTSSQSSAMRNSSTSRKDCAPQPEGDALSFILPTTGLPRKPQFQATFGKHADVPRSIPSIGNSLSERRLSAASVTKQQLTTKRASFLADTSPFLTGRHSFASFGDLDPPVDDSKPPSPPRRSSKRLTKSSLIASKQSLSFDVQKKGLHRKSMPQLANGPPPVPPPTSALPPIPKKYDEAMNGSLRRIRA